jgi:hypothetical protein
VQKLFSMFPAGVPGVALVLLRLSVAAVLFVDQHGRLFAPMPSWLMLLALVVALALCCGCLTPFFAVVAGLLELVENTCPTSVPLLPLSAAGCTPMVLVSLLVAAAVAMLGPGAYSFDARMFGRRVVLLPPPR